MLPVSAFLDYKQDTTINCASVVCDTKSKQPVRRSSSTRGKSTPPTGELHQKYSTNTFIFFCVFENAFHCFFYLKSVRTDFTNFVQTENVILQPGNNTIELTAKATRVGLWNFKQVRELIDFNVHSFLKYSKKNNNPHGTLISALNLHREIGFPIRIVARQVSTIRNNNESSIGRA